MHVADEHTTQRPGVIDSGPAVTPIHPDFEDAFAAWLAEALDLPAGAVSNGWKTDKAGFPDRMDFASFAIGAPTETEHYTESFEDGAQVVAYGGTLPITISLLGPNARLLGWHLCDLFAIEQNADALELRCGLGFTDASIQALLLEPVGGQLRERVDVVLTFTYRYTRRWAVRSIVDVPVEIIGD